MGAYELSLVTLVGINVILALSLNLITGFCGQISLGHAAFYGTGAYACALISQAGLPFYAGLAVGALVAGGDGEPDLSAQGVLLAHDAEEQETHAHGRDRQEVMAHAKAGQSDDDPQGPGHQAAHGQAGIER